MGQALTESPRLLAIVDRATCGSDAAFSGRAARLRAMLDDEPLLAVRLRGPSELVARVAAEVRPHARLVVPAAVGATLAGCAVAWAAGDGPGDVSKRGPRPSARLASVHSVDEAAAAEALAADVLVFAPVFAPRCKPGEGRGLAALAEIAARTHLPVIALGGVTPDRVASCIEAGARGVAALTPFSSPDADPLAAVRDFLAALEG